MNACNAHATINNKKDQRRKKEEYKESEKSETRKKLNQKPMTTSRLVVHFTLIFVLCFHCCYHFSRLRPNEQTNNKQGANQRARPWHYFVVFFSYHFRCLHFRLAGKKKWFWLKSTMILNDIEMILSSSCVSIAMATFSTWNFWYHITVRQRKRTLFRNKTKRMTNNSSEKKMLESEWTRRIKL